MDNTYTKGTIAGISGFLFYMMNCINEIVVGLVCLMLVDYITGLLAAYLTKTINPEVGRKGAIKKLGFFFLIFLAFCLDFVVTFMAQRMGVQLSTFGLFGLSTCCWLVGTESLSIIDNLNRMGVPVPKFLTSAFERVKNICEQSVKEGEVKHE